MLAEGGALGAPLVIMRHVMGMAPESLLEGGLAEPGVGLLGDDGQGRGWLLLGGRHLGLVDHAGGQAVTLKRAGRRAGCAVAIFPHGHLWPHVAQHLLVVLGKQLGHVGHRPVGGFDGVPVEGAPQDMADWKTVINDLKEGAGNVGLHLL